MKHICRSTYCIVYLCLLILVSGFGNGYAQVTAAFTSSPTASCSPLSVAFIDQSTGAVNSWLWNFGNGNTSNLQNPGTTYLIAGTYTVTLTVSDGSNSDTETKISYITVYANPSPSFTFNPSSGCAGLSVQFTDQSLPGDAAILSWLWDFNDGGTSNLQNPVHLFNTPGSYYPTLFTLDANGCSAVYQSTSPVQISSKPAANFGPNQAIGCGAPFSVNFQDSTVGSGIYSYQWGFGDGGSSSLQNPTHIYNSTGSFNVQLIVSDSLACADTLSQTGMVNIGRPSAAFVVSRTRICEGQNLQFFDQSTGNPNVWIWNFGDGSQPDSSQNPVHAYANPGFYSVQLEAYGAAACGDTLLQINYIEVLPAPQAAFSGDTLGSCKAPFTVNFMESSLNAVQYFWDFGDGATSSAQNPTHTYLSPGSFDVTLVVVSADTCYDTLVRLAYVEIIEPTANFTWTTVQQGCRPLTFKFNDSTYTRFDSITTWQWDFGDGGTSSNQSPNNNYNTIGTWDVTFIVTTSKGCTDTLFIPSFISIGPDPGTNFTATPTNICFGTPIQFTDQSVQATSWVWDFGDGNTSSLQNPAHIYADTGCFDISLHSAISGCEDSLTRAAYVCVSGPRADFTMSITGACDTPATVNFTNTSLGTNLKWVWDFGDGNQASGLNPAHTYTAFGIYNIELYVEDTLTGCIDTIQQPFSITDPILQFAVNSSKVCIPQGLSFTDSTVGAVSWLWDFGDGNTSNLQNPFHAYTLDGNYDVQLTVTDISGCVDSILNISWISAFDISANFMALPRQACVGDAIVFSDNSFGTTGPIAWNWDFGDGGTNTGQNPVHSYSAPGTYSTSLNVMDANGCSDTILQSAFIEITRPVAQILLSDTVFCIAEPFQAGSPLASSYAWQFGDGNSSALQNPMHAFAQSGSFSLSLAVTDSNACADTAFQTIIVQQPQAAFSLSDSSSSCPPLLIDFTDQSIPNIVAWNWDFGDGATSAQQNPSHLYLNNGAYAVTLIVTTDQGCMDTLFASTAVQVFPPSPGFNIFPNLICEGQSVSMGVNSGPAISHIWDFGDGNLVSSGDSVSHVYNFPGTYYPSVILQDSSGCSYAVNGIDSVIVRPAPMPAFSSSSSRVCAPDTVFFNDASTSVSPLSSFQWSFGDGSGSTSANPAHIYTNAGTYDLSFTVTDSFGCSDSVLQIAYVRVFDPQANFSLDTSWGCLPLLVNFNDASTADTTLTSWTWDLGDGNTASGNPATHVFIDSGTYDVQLIIANALGCLDTVQFNDLVQVISYGPAAPVDMRNASVPANVDIDISWLPASSAGAAEIDLERSLDGNIWTPLATLPATDTTYTDLNPGVQAQSWFYRAWLRDSCGDISAAFSIAKTVLLSINDSTGAVRLTWTPYQGWNNGVDQYILEFRAANSTVWQSLAVLPGSQLSWTDENQNIGTASRCFRVTAYENGGNLANSRSNEVCSYQELWIPNTLTPNGDGANDIFAIPGLGAFPSAKLNVFNRWGSQVFEAPGYQNNWDGSNQKTGEALPDGTYFFILQLNQGGRLLKGYVTIMR